MIGTCRFCKQADMGLMKYGPRHYAHARCYLGDRVGPNGGGYSATARHNRLTALRAALDDLPVSTLERFPVIATFDADEMTACSMAGLGMTGRQFMDYFTRRRADAESLRRTGGR